MNKRKKKRTKGLQEKNLASLWFKKKEDIFSVAKDKNKLKKNLKQYLLFKNK